MQVGRYLVLDRIGAGGIGEVYSAYDPELDRKVALKLLRSDPSRPGHAQARARFVREARAMAAVSDANIIAVHDVGTHGSDAFFAMELVRGGTLGQWLAQRPRRARDVIRVLVQAGRGLAAAHTQGLVHCDFKPDNVLVGDDGRVRVSDFGMVRSRGDAAYAAPEQLRGRPSDARSDQFSFCVTLHEALYGERPFFGNTDAELLDEIDRGSARRPQQSRGVPRRVRRALATGLQSDPQHRFASMQDLLRALSARPVASWGWPGAAALSVLGIGFVVNAWMGGDGPERCEPTAWDFEGVWDDDLRASVQAALLDTGRPYAPAAWTHVETGFDEYRVEWREQYADACAATVVRGEQSPALMDARMACLRRAKASLRAGAAVLAEADADVALNAHRIVAGLPPLSRCAETEALRSEPSLPAAEADAEAVQRAHDQIQAVNARLDAAQYDEALRMAEELEGASIDYPPIRAEIALQAALVQASTGKPEVATAALESALRLSLEVEQWGLAARAAVVLTCHLGGANARVPEGLAYADVAAGLLGRDGASGHVTAQLAQCLAQLRIRQGDYADAEADADRAVALYTELYGDDDHRVAWAISRKADALRFLERPRAALENYQRALEIQMHVLGPHHPDVATTRMSMGFVMARLGQDQGVEAQYQQALDVLVAASDGKHPNVTVARATLAGLYLDQERYAEAEQAFRRVQTDFERLRGPDHPATIKVTASLGRTLREQGRAAAAERTFRDAAARAERGLAPDHPLATMVLRDLASHLRQQGAVHEPRRIYEGVWAIHDSDPSRPPIKRARVAAALAQLLWEDRRSRARALELARVAKAAFVAADAVDDDFRTWLSSIDRPYDSLGPPSG